MKRRWLNCLLGVGLSLPRGSLPFYAMDDVIRHGFIFKETVPEGSSSGD